MTFSIVAFDVGDTVPEWGVAVASKCLAVGAAVPWARAGAGVLAAQALASPGVGREGLRMLEDGQSARSTINALVAATEGSEHIQLASIDSQGEIENFTGRGCAPWAGSRIGTNYSCQGNTLMAPEVLDAMADAFGASDGDLEDRLILALSAGENAGGDSRGRQSASLLVVRDKSAFGKSFDRYMDLRVDDHTDPIPELQRLLELRRFASPRSLDLVAIDSDLVSELGTLLGLGGSSASRGGPSDLEAAVSSALFQFACRNNLEERWISGPQIDKTMLEELRRSVRDVDRRDRG